MRLLCSALLILSLLAPGGRLDPQGPVTQTDLSAALARLALPPPVSHSLPRIRKGGRP